MTLYKKAGEVHPLVSLRRVGIRPLAIAHSIKHTMRNGLLFLWVLFVRRGDQYAVFSSKYFSNCAMGKRTCAMLSRSRTVTLLSSSVSKSTVMQ